jgi:hypothetical protein
MVIADRRTHIKSNGTESYQDDFSKVLLHKGYIVYNHGYNRINDKDWKLRIRDLTPDNRNIIYTEIQHEMETKIDKTAFYVFMNMTTLIEIKISAESSISIHSHMPKDRIVSGSGGIFIDDLSSLTNLNCLECGVVRPKLIHTFKMAYSKMIKSNGTEFSHEFDLVKIRK